MSAEIISFPKKHRHISPPMSFHIDMPRMHNTLEPSPTFFRDIWTQIRGLNAEPQIVGLSTGEAD